MGTRADAGGGGAFWGDVDDETALRRYRSLVGATDDGIYQLDAEDRFVAANEGLLETTGYARDELLGEHVSVVLADGDLEAVERAIRARTNADADADDDVDGSTSALEVRLHGADGGTVPCELRLSPLSDGDEFRGTIGVARDVSERNRRERRLERELAAVHDRVSDAFFAVDETWAFTHLNEHAEELINPEGRDLIGENLWEQFPAAVGDFKPKFERAMAEREPVTFEEYYPDPLDAWFEVRAYPSETGLAVYFRDVTERKERERQLERTEHRYRTLVEYFPNGAVALVDRDLRYTTFGGTPEGNVDLTRGDIEGTPVRELPEKLNSVVAPRYEAALEGETAAFECEIDDRVYQFRFVPIRDDAGEVFAALGMSQEITEQKEHERYLDDAKTQLEAATEAGAVGTWEWNIPEDRFVTGPSFARTFGVDPDEAREGVPLERLLDAVHEDDRERVTERIEAAVESGGDYEEEYRVRNADGEIRWVVARGHVECDADGDPITFPGALTDITERKRAEIESRKQRRQLETLFDVLPVGAVVADADGSLIRANDAAREIWGGDVFDEESVEAYDKYPAVWADTGEPVAPDDWTMYQVLHGAEVMEPNIYEIDAFDGERRIIMEHGMPVRDERGDVSRAVVTLTDITERRTFQRKLEATIDELEASNERLEQFAYAASHDLQEPLRMITSYLQLVENRYVDDLDEDGREFVDFAVDGADRMREMIDGLLEYSRVETRGDPFGPVDLNDVLEDVVDDLQLQITETDADIAVDDLPRVEGDASQLRQVFQNLVDNALTYHGDEPPEITIDAARRGSRWEISVRDSGIGIDPDDQDRVFTVFDRLHSRDEYEGTGIGLALCQRIVERHGGDIWVDSEPGEGSTFSVTLPALE